ncbi:MAG TPA: cytochrome c [Acetobacteraceae bacterium]|nr:cytochrome c [Acetobacteraceae bacterium]
MTCLRMRAALWAAALTILAVPGWAQTGPVERGRYLVEGIVACGNCHTPKGPDGRDLPGRNLAGGQVIEEPNLFRAVASNITPDRETGIGNWTDAQLGRAIREGIRPDGSLIGPPMPFEFYRDISDSDLAAMIAYLRSLPAVSNRVERSRYSIPLPPAYGPPVASVPDPPAGDAVARGAYLAGPLGHCLDCHTPRGPDMQLQRQNLGAGGLPISGPWGVVVSRNITPHREEGIGAWTDEQVIAAITRAEAPGGRRLGPPMGYGYYARMNERDLRDVVAYLRSLPARP